MTEQATEADQDDRNVPGRRSRRQLLTRGAGALTAVLAAEAIARPAPAYAGTDGDVVLGKVNNETTTTTINSTASGGVALFCTAIGADGIGVLAEVADGVGVSGTSDSAVGVAGQTTTGAGVSGESIGSGVGVRGTSDSGAGVSGSSNTESGVAGSSKTGSGVFGSSQGGTGVLAAGKRALWVLGPAVFSRSGTLSIPAGRTSATQRGVPLTSASLVLVTAQNDVPGMAVRSAVPDVASRSFTVHLAKAVTRVVTVAWFVVN